MAPNASSSDLGERKTGEHNITFAEYKHGLVDTRFLKRSSTMSLISIGLCSRDKNVFTLDHDISLVKNYTRRSKISGPFLPKTKILSEDHNIEFFLFFLHLKLT